MVCQYFFVAKALQVVYAITFFTFMLYFIIPKSIISHWYKHNGNCCHPLSPIITYDFQNFLLIDIFDTIYIFIC